MTPGGGWRDSGEVRTVRNAIVGAYGIGGGDPDLAALLDEAFDAVWASAVRGRAEQAKDEIGWLLEYHLDQEIDGVRRPTWCSGFEIERHGRYSLHERPSEHVRPVPTHEHSVAVRFSRQRDAEAALQIIPQPYRGLLKVSEHCHERPSQKSRQHRREDVFLRPDGTALFGGEARRAQRPTLEELQQILDEEAKPEPFDTPRACPFGCTMTPPFTSRRAAGWITECGSCGAHQNIGKPTEADAIQAWNRRADTPSLPPVARSPSGPPQEAAQ